MKTFKKKYHRYLLTYPYEGGKVYKARELNDAIKKCYKEFKSLNDIKDGMFGITDLDSDTEYQFKAQNNNIYRMKNSQKGGEVESTVIETSPPVNDSQDNNQKAAEDLADIQLGINSESDIRNHLDNIISEANSAKNMVGANNDDSVSGIQLEPSIKPAQLSTPINQPSEQITISSEEIDKPVQQTPIETKQTDQPITQTPTQPKIQSSTVQTPTQPISQSPVQPQVRSQVQPPIQQPLFIEKQNISNHSDSYGSYLFGDNLGDFMRECEKLRDPPGQLLKRREDSFEENSAYLGRYDPFGDACQIM